MPHPQTSTQLSLQEPSHQRRGHAVAVTVLAYGVTSLWAGAALAQQPAQSEAASPPVNSINLTTSTLKPALLEMVLNGQAQDVTECLLGADGSVWVPVERFAQWRLRVPQAQVHQQDGTRWLPLHAISGAVIKVNQTSAQLQLQVPAVAFTATAVGVPSREYEPQAAPFGLSMNYDVQLQNSSATSATSTSTDANTVSTAPRNLSGLFELGAFSGAWTFNHQWLAPDVTKPSSYVRLDTTLQRDFADRVSSLKIGDTLGRSGLWGKSTRFAGISYATNFSVRPNLITFALPQVRGLAAAPSAIDVFVNEQQRFNTNVGTGPFEVRDIPAVSGAGQVKVQTRDLLGRTQTFVVPFYSSPALLKKGLHDYAFELGAQRNSFAIRSNDYGQAFMHASDRYGLTDTVTLEGRLEVTRSQRTAGVGVTTLLGHLGLLNAAAAVSRDAQGRSGRLTSIGFEREAQNFNFGVRTEQRSLHFVQLGQDPAVQAPTRRTSANFGLPLGRVGNVNLGSLGVALTADQGVAVGQPRQTALLSYSVNVARQVGVSMTLGRTLSQQYGGPSSLPFSAQPLVTRRDTQFAVSLSIPLDGGMSAGGSASSNRSSTGSSNAQAQFELRRNTPDEGGIGWRVAAVQQTQSAQPSVSRLDGQLLYLGQAGQLSLQGSQSGSSNAWRIGAQGAVVWMDSTVWASRRLGQSFAAVRVGDAQDPIPNVRVYQQNRLLGRTNESGRIFVPSMPAYEPSNISIAPTDVPLAYDFTAARQSVVPPARAGVVVSFGARKLQAALLGLRQGSSANAPWVPAGARVTVEPASTEAALQGLVVVERGQLYVPQTAGIKTLRVQWTNDRQQTLRCVVPLESVITGNRSSAQAAEPMLMIESTTCAMQR